MINSTTSSHMLAYIHIYTHTHIQASHLLKYDSMLGTFKADVKIVDNETISVDGKHIKVVSNRDPLKLPWTEMGIDIVIEVSHCYYLALYFCSCSFFSDIGLLINTTQNTGNRSVCGWTRSRKTYPGGC